VFLFLFNNFCNFQISFLLRYLVALFFNNLAHASHGTNEIQSKAAQALLYFSHLAALINSVGITHS